MIELVDTLPDINVQPAEYKRLLGFPRDYVLSGRPRELADWARDWYTKHGKPWVYARETTSLAMNNGSVVLDGVSFTSPRLQKTLQQPQAHGAILVAVSAGPEIEAEAQRVWLEEKPDEYFFLEIYGSAVVEHLTTMTGARLCAWAESHGMAVLPHYSPGYPEWDISQQPGLLDLLRRSNAAALPGPLLPGPVESLDSGMLKPKKSLLAVFGLTRYSEHVRKLTDLVPCENCSFSPCQYRRVPYRRSPEFSKVELKSRQNGSEVVETSLDDTIAESAEASAEIAPVLKLDATYFVNAKALRRWVTERLALTHNEDGTVDALFKYDGTTCSNMGRTLSFEYKVKIGPREQGYRILEMHCGPAANDDGHRFMCRYMSNAEHLMVAIDHEKPLLGQPLNDVLSWQRAAIAPACYCEPASRKHKWGIALETIHYAMVEREKTMAVDGKWKM
jgi:hypothetical protein